MQLKTKSTTRFQVFFWGTWPNQEQLQQKSLVKQKLKMCIFHCLRLWLTKRLSCF